MNTLRPRPSIRLALLIALALLGAACAPNPEATDTTDPAGTVAEVDSATTSSEPVVEDEHDHEDTDGEVDAEATEQEVAQPRLLVADAEDGTVAAFDLASGDAVGSIAVTAPARLTTIGDGRFVLASQGSADRVDIVDGGAWSEAHGDHSHHYTGELRTVGSVGGPSPAHMVTHGGMAALFFDGTGNAVIVDEATLAEGSIDIPWVVDTGAPQHGVVVPFDGHWVATIPSEVEGELPVGVQVMHGVEVEDQFANCPELHGEMGTESTLAFACANGVLVLGGGEGSWEADKIPYPPELEARVWSLTGGHDLTWTAGVLQESAEPYASLPSVLVVDMEAASASVIDLPAPTYAAVADPETGMLLVVALDGGVHLIDPATGELTASNVVLSPFELDYSQPLPSVVMSGSHAYVSEPATGTIHAVSLDDELTVTATLETEGTPGSIAIVGD